MGRIAKLISFLRATRNGAKVSDVKTDSGGGANITAENFQPAGDDSYPLTSDYVALVPVAKTGGKMAVGYLDPINAPKANAGDKRIYARDASDGSVVVEIWLKNDGSTVIDNGEGVFELKPSGVVEINGATITTDGDVITALGVSLNNHTHVGNLGSPTSKPIL